MDYLSWPTPKNGLLYSDRKKSTLLPDNGTLSGKYHRAGSFVYQPAAVPLFSYIAIATFALPVDGSAKELCTRNDASQRENVNMAKKEKHCMLESGG